jgi:hypothetical protein
VDTLLVAFGYFWYYWVTLIVVHMAVTWDTLGVFFWLPQGYLCGVWDFGVYGVNMVETLVDFGYFGYHEVNFGFLSGTL